MMTHTEAIAKATEILPDKVLALYVPSVSSRVAIYGFIAARIYAHANGLLIDHPVEEKVNG